MEEIPRGERSISSEPCSGRPNPFNDVTEQTSRKRQRVSRTGSERSRSVDTARDLDIVPELLLQKEGSPKADAEPNPTPSTPTREPSEQPPTSSRVTINLRTTRQLEAIPSSPQSPATPSKMVNEGEDAGTRISVESESDALSTIPAIETPSSSPSPIGSPTVELVVQSEDESDFGGHDPPVAIIDDDTDSVYLDPLASFPYWAEGETLSNTLGRVARFLQYDDIQDDSSFCKLRDWIEGYLLTHTHPDTFYEMYAKNHEFWNKFPDLIWALSYRSRFFGDFLQRSTQGRQALTDMLCQFARLTGRFLAMDVRTLTYHAQKNITDQDPDLGSRPFLFALSFLLRKDEASHIGRNLETHYQWNWDEDIAMLSDSFQTEGGTILALTKLIQGLLRLMPRNPKIIDNLTDPCRIVGKLVADAASSMDDGELQHQQVIDATHQKIMQGYEFFKVMSKGLEIIIEKHVTCLLPESAAAHLYGLTSIFRHALLVDNHATHELLENIHIENPRLARKTFPRVISTEWKFGILKKLITSAQMQLRVVGVTTMCTDLLALYTQCKGLDATTSPVLLHFADFILRNQLVDYLVGIGSHPEIINESNNILGFLIVTKTYKPQQSDKIWQTVMSSQDPRVVEAILRMLIRCLNLFDLRSMVYLCQKACDVPIEAFTPTMREFCQGLFKELVGKSNMDGAHYVDPAPYNLCVRLIRQSSIISADSPAGYPDIQNFAASRFRELLIAGPGPETRTSIYLSCIKDISARTSTAPGSICVINALLRQNTATDLRTLTTEHGLTQLLVEEIEAAASSDRHSSYQSVRNSPASQARRELLMFIIINEPDTITADLGKRLWDVLVGAESKTPAERTTSWQILNNAVKKSSIRNIFLATCYKEHLPNLPPHCFTTGTLEFAREAILSWLEEIRNDFVEEDRAFESPALEQLWRMILTAPVNTIDAAAINILVEVYVDHPLVLSMPKPKARSIHLALVDRCLDQLKGAAAKLQTFSDGASSGSEEGMVIVASEDQFQEQENIFARSLAALREFLRAYHSKQHFAPPKSRSSIATATSTVEGEPLTLKYQSFDGDQHTDVKSLTLGKLNPAASLFASLEKATGFKSYKVYCDGKVLDPDEIEVCKSLNDLNLKGLVLVKRFDETESSGQNGGKPTLELEIMKHFDDLWSYLSMHEKVAQEIYYFLVKFPVYDRLMKDFESATSHSDIFPLGQPFKSLYAVHALREYIAIRTQKVSILRKFPCMMISSLFEKGSVEETALARAISLIVAAISDRDVLDHCGSDELRDFLALHLIDSFVNLLKEPVLPPAVVPCLNDALLQRLLQLLYDAKRIDASQNSAHVTWRAFEALLEASMHSPEYWQSFASHLHNSTLLRDLLLEDARPAIRRSVGKQIQTKCSFSPSLAKVSTSLFISVFWPMIASLIPEAVLLPLQCEETFLLASNLFKRLVDTTGDSMKIDVLVNQWGGLLLSHTCAESVGYPDSVDMVAHGLSQLLVCATGFAKNSKQSLTCSALGTELFRKHLFPDISLDDDEDRLIVPKTPLLNPLTRQTTAEAIFYLVRDDEVQYKAVMGHLAALVPYAGGDDGPYVYDLAFQFERSKSIRSHTGYVGLRNLSNTCYLNSLFTQLFMNIPFREFMLEAYVADGGASQKLLSETQNLFSYMQNSLRRFVDPANLAGSIRTYEETPIDVTIQMDVDEFYNLLFDRWESQILAADAKKRFRSFYGGQLVQQIKSKECPHISERLEPFSAIQCDIKGKTCLQESLQAYVDGDIMEGDNKYKCSTCDRHVDAVKRACLKDVPDNLIFHLKRFDFNLRTLQRSKINDYFSFPTKIDMRPYKVEHLMDNPEDTPEDIFELVGILVHSGTAESGHYYSFIRERPSNGDKENWVEFNDDCVSPWDPTCMEGSCFGGPDYRGPVEGGNLQFDKSWSAYMLFYQRSSTLATQKQTLNESRLSSPVRLPVPQRLANHIAMENELLIRKYCLYDPAHAVFVTKMLSNMRQINGGQCSVSHDLEKLVLTSSLNHLDQVIARTKDLPDFPTFMLTVRQLCHSCAECSRDYLEWYCDCPETLRHLLLRNPDGVVRSEIAGSILAALNKVKRDASYAYGFGDDDDSADDLEGGDPRVIQRVVKSINKLWDMFHTNLRAWPEYFGLLFSIAKMGKREAAVLLDAGFLYKVLNIVSADHLLAMGAQYTKMLNIISKRLTTRPVSFDAVISLLCQLIQTCDASREALSERPNRVQLAIEKKPIPFTEDEQALLVQHWLSNRAHIMVEKLLQIHQNPAATEAIIINLLNWPDSIDTFIYQAITHGIRKVVSSVPCAAFLRAALIYCEHSRNPKAIPTMVMHVSRTAQHLENTEGKEFLQFFKDITTISGQTEMSKLDLFKFYLDQLCCWGPGLLTYYDASVRSETEDFIQELLLRHGPDVDFGPSDDDVEKATMITQGTQKLGIACLDYLDATYVRSRQTAVRATLVNIEAVIEACREFFSQNSPDPLTRRFQDLMDNVIPNLRKFTVEEADEEVSATDWDGSDGEYDGSSEPMDSIAELGDVDAQL